MPTLEDLNIAYENDMRIIGLDFREGRIPDKATAELQRNSKWETFLKEAFVLTKDPKWFNEHIDSKFNIFMQVSRVETRRRFYDGEITETQYENMDIAALLQFGTELFVDGYISTPNPISNLEMVDIVNTYRNIQKSVKLTPNGIPLTEEEEKEICDNTVPFLTDLLNIFKDFMNV